MWNVSLPVTLTGSCSVSVSFFSCPSPPFMPCFFLPSLLVVKRKCENLMKGILSSLEGHTGMTLVMQEWSGTLSNWSFRCFKLFWHTAVLLLWAYLRFFYCIATKMVLYSKFWLESGLNSRKKQSVKTGDIFTWLHPGSQTKVIYLKIFQTGILSR